MSQCCIECFVDPILQEAIKVQGHIADCPYCESTGVYTAPLKLVGQLIRDGVDRAYRDASEEAGPNDSEIGKCLWNDPGDAPSLLEILTEHEGIFSDALAGTEARLLQDLLDASRPTFHRQKDELTYTGIGDIGTLLYPRNDFLGAQETLFDTSWAAFKFRVRHIARFFDAAGLGAHRHSLLGRVQKRLAKLEFDLPAGSRLFRARPVEEKQPMPTDDSVRALEIGPAPALKSKGNRMSPRGISYTYLSLDADTALKESQAKAGKRCWIGEFKTRKGLRLVDLSITTGWKPQSIFDPKYDHEFRQLTSALREFADEVAQPIAHDDEALDYVATQVLTEFLRANGADGVQYKSARRSGGINITLFCGRPLDELEREGVTPSIDPGAPEKWGEGFTSFLEWLDLITLYAEKAV